MEEEEPTMTINDVIQEEEESTAMVLGGLERSFLEKCTYSEVGFISIFIPLIY